MPRDDPCTAGLWIKASQYGEEGEERVAVLRKGIDRIARIS